MQSRDFCFWLQGFFELSDEATALSADQAATIRRHLDMVFHHEIAPQSLGLKARELPIQPTPVPPFPTAPPEPNHDPVREPQQPAYPQPPAPLC